MINNPHPFKGLNTRILILNPISGRGFVNHGSTLGLLFKGIGYRAEGLVSYVVGFRDMEATWK